jgi:hypothetical protein
MLFLLPIFIFLHFTQTFDVFVLCRAMMSVKCYILFDGNDHLQVYERQLHEYTRVAYLINLVANAYNVSSARVNIFNDGQLVWGSRFVDTLNRNKLITIYISGS